MKVYVTARFKGAENKADIEALCGAVKNAGMEDFNFTRDIENYQKIFHDPKELWQRSLGEVKKCDALLIDVSDAPTGGRVVEVGMAYALDFPIFVIVKKGIVYKEIFTSLATKVIEYETFKDVTASLTSYMQQKI